MLTQSTKFINNLHHHSNFGKERPPRIGNEVMLSPQQPTEWNDSLNPDSAEDLNSWISIFWIPNRRELNELKIEIPLKLPVH